MAEFKFFCPQCGQHILCDTGYSGQQINCPVCQKLITVPQAPAASMPAPPPPPAPVYALHQSPTSAASQRQYPVTPVAQPAVPIQSRALRTVLIIVVAVLALAGLGVGGWYGYTHLKIFSHRGHLPSGVIALWSGEGSANDSVGAHPGQLVNGVGFAPGKVGSAFDFHDSSYVEIQPMALTNFTIVCWLKQRTRVPVSATVSGWGCPILSDEVCGVVDDWHLGLLNEGQLLINIGDGTRGFDSQFKSAGIIPLNTFVHVAFTRSTVTGTIALYINGVLDSTFTAPHNRVMGIASPGCDVFPNTIGIGCLRRYATLGFSNCFDGLIDEPAIFNRALSAEEIQQIYAAQK